MIYVPLESKGGLRTLIGTVEVKELTQVESILLVFFLDVLARAFSLLNTNDDEEPCRLLCNMLHSRRTIQKAGLQVCLFRPCTH